MDLLIDSCRPLVHRIVDNTCEVVSCGRLPPEGASDPVRWVNRSQNTMADHLCNRTMDVVKGAWREERNFDIPPRSSIVISSDGGTRATCPACA
eukprot:843032-Pyramimonas_sp.AAC.1